MNALDYFPDLPVIEDQSNTNDESSTSTLSAVNETAIIFENRESDRQLIKDTWKKVFVDRFTGQQIFAAIQATKAGEPVAVSKRSLLHL
jgi:hypothetical protein